MEDHRSLNRRPTLRLERVVILRRRRPRIAPWNAADLVEDMNRGNRDAEVFTLTCGFCLAQLWRGEPHTGACNEANGERS